MQGLLPKVNKSPMVHDYNEDFYNTLKTRQDKALKNNITLKDILLYLQGLQYLCKERMVDPGHMILL